MIRLCLALALSAATQAPAATPARPPSSLESLAETIKTQIARAQPEAPVALAVEGPQLDVGRAFTALLAARVAVAKLAPMPIDPKDAEFRAQGRGARTLVRLTVSVDGTKLNAHGEVYSVWVNFWSGQSPSRDPKAALVGATVDADAEALALAGASVPTPVAATSASLELRASVVAKFAGTPSAVAAVDFDQDGKTDLIAVIANEEVLGFQPDGRLLGRVDLSGGPAAALPTRDAFAALSVSAAPMRVSAYSAKRARGESFTFSGGTLRPFGTTDSVSVEALSLKFEPGLNRYSTDAVWAGRAVSLGALGPQAVSTRGALTLFVLPDGTASLTRGTAPQTKMTGVGTGSTLADFDGDGVPELILSTSKTVGDDEVKVVSVSTFDAVASRQGTFAEATPLWQSPLLRGRDLAACPAELDGARGDEAILVTALSDGTGEVVVLRKEAP